MQVAVFELAVDEFGEDGAEIGGYVQVAALVELFAFEAGPGAIDATAADAAAESEHDVGVAVVGAAIAVFLDGTAEFGHGDEGDIGHAVAHIEREGGERLTKFVEQAGELSGFG